MNKLEAYTAQLLDLKHSLAAPLFSKFNYPWEVLPHIKGFIASLSEELPASEYEEVEEGVFVHISARIFPTAYIDGPCIIGPRTEIRHCAFLRGSAIIGADCVVGNSTELKNVILFDHVQVPHYNYVGDSILGYYAHMGEGSITSNVKSDKALVKVHFEDGDMETGLKKFGAVIGDHVEVGCGSVLNPGSVIGRNSNIYPLSSVRKAVSASSIYKSSSEIARKEGVV